MYGCLERTRERKREWLITSGPRFERRPATGPQKHVTQETKDAWVAAETAGAIALKSPQQGAATTLVAAVALEFRTAGGHYLDDGNEVPTIPDDAEAGLTTHGIRAWAKDPDTAQKLWDLSLDLTGIPYTRPR